MKAINRILSSRKNILLVIYAVGCIVGGQFFVSFLYKDLETKRNHFVEIAIGQDTIIDVFKNRYTPGKGSYTEIKTAKEPELPLLLETESNLKYISTDAIISKEKDSVSFKIINAANAYNFRLRSLTSEKTTLRFWILICTTLVAFGVLRNIFKAT